MRTSRRLGIALSCACTTSAALAFVPNVGSGWGAVRPRQGIEGCTSSVIAGRQHGGSFMGAPIVRCGPAAGWRDARCGRSGRGRRWVTGRVKITRAVSTPGWTLRVVTQSKLCYFFAKSFILFVCSVLMYHVLMQREHTFFASCHVSLRRDF